MLPSRRDLLRAGGGALVPLLTSGCLADAGGPATTPADDTQTERTDAPATATQTSDPSSPTPSPHSPSPTSAADSAHSISTADPARSTPTDTPSAEERIVVALHNERDTEVTVSVTVSGGGERLAEAERTLSAGGYDAVFTGIREMGAYEATVETDDGVLGSYAFTVEKWDVRMGSNVVVRVGVDDIEFATEE